VTVEEILCHFMDILSVPTNSMLLCYSSSCLCCSNIISSIMQYLIQIIWHHIILCIYIFHDISFSKSVVEVYIQYIRTKKPLSTFIAVYAFSMPLTEQYRSNTDTSIVLRS